MFKGATSFTGDGISNWNTDRVDSLPWTFSACPSFTGDSLSNWNTASVTDFQGVFDGSSAFTGYSMIRWNIDKVPNITKFRDAFINTNAIQPCTKRFIARSNSWQNNAAFMSAYGNDWLTDVPESECPCDFEADNYRLRFYVDDWLRDSVRI